MAVGRDRIVDYQASPTISKFIQDESFVCGIRGPVGSAKTTACVMKVILHAQSQQPDDEGWRKTRVCVTRRTGPQLKTTTINTWKYWLGGDDLGEFTWSAPAMQRLRWAMPDGTKVDCEVIFLPLDGDDDIGKVKSLEISMLWCNEMSEMDWDVFEEAIKRPGRYPPEKKDAKGKRIYGCTRRQVIFDTNAPPMESMLYRQFEEVKPEGWVMYRQPPAAFKDPNGHHRSAEGTKYRLNPKAENVEWLPDGYYATAINGISDRSIQVFVLNEYGTLLSGRPVFTSYRDKLHYSEVPLIIYTGLPIRLSFDFGGTTTCLIRQYTPNGQLRCLRELCSELNLQPFVAQLLRPTLDRFFHGIPLAKGICDPSGRIRNSSGLSMIEELARAGFDVEACDIQGTESDPELEMRKGAVDWFLTNLVDGEPALLLDPSMVFLRSGFLGRYRYPKQSNREGDTVFRPKPLKNHPVSDIHDCLQYDCYSIRGKKISQGADVSKLLARQRAVAAARRGSR